MVLTSLKRMKVWQHLCLKPPTIAEAPWPSQTLLFVDYEGEISPAVARWLCVCEHAGLWLIIVIWTDCRLHALLLSLHTHYIWGHAACCIAAAPNWWDLAARDLNIASPTIAPGACVFASVIVGFCIINVFMVMIKYVSSAQGADWEESILRLSGVIYSLLLFKVFD